MERKLPIAEIAGTSFYVDVLREELRQTDKSENRISFNELAETGEGYSFNYDIRTKNIPQRDADVESDREYLVKVTLPALMELDPEGIAEKYGIPIEALSPSFPYPESKVKATIHPLQKGKGEKNE